MLNNSDGKVTVYNMTLDTMRFLPASTFKIVNSLIGLETGRISDEKMVIKWDGIKRWNEDHPHHSDLMAFTTESFEAYAVPQLM